MHCQQTFSTTQWEAQIGVTLSVAARLGMMMGLNKLTPEKVGSGQRPGLLKREVSRLTGFCMRILTNVVDSLEEEHGGI